MKRAFALRLLQRAYAFALFAAGSCFFAARCGAFIVTLLCFRLGVLAVNAAIPPFTAEGTVATRSFDVIAPDVVYEQEADFVFSFSNGWWDVRSTYTKEILPGFDSPFQRTTLDCSRISDGVQLLLLADKAVQPTNKTTLPTAMLYPFHLPPPETAVLFMPWLALCPNPDLPWTTNGLMPRLTNSKLFTDSRNLGHAHVDYIYPGHTFLSGMEITNQGVTIISGGKLSKYSKPFDHGFKDFEYRLFGVTNIDGFAFPMQAVLYRYGASPGVRNLNELKPFSITRLDVHDIRIGNPPSVEVPKTGYVSDRRPSVKIQVQQAKIYDESADGSKQIADALVVATKERKRVLLQFGANWCGWCHKLHDLFETDKSIAATLKNHYVVVLIDVNLGHNSDIDTKYGHPTQLGLPAIVILDDDGKQLTTQDTGKLEQGDRHDPEKVMAFLKEWSPKK